MNKQNKGRLIVIEGLDGSGKATQTASLTRFLRGRGERVCQVSFPDYGSQSSALVRMYLDGGIGGVGDVNAYAASSFYAADRYVSYHNSWKKPYQTGHTIVADRYTTSNAAHQMSKLPREEWDGFLAWLEDYEYRRLALPAPDLVVYLDMLPAVSRALILSRSAGGRELDIHEQAAGYLESCREAALYAAEALGWRVIRCDDGESPESVEDVFAKIKLIPEVTLKGKIL